MEVADGHLVTYAIQGICEAATLEKSEQFTNKDQDFECLQSFRNAATRARKFILESAA